MMGSRPFVTINTAMTADGKIDTVARQGAAISSPDDWERVDRMRAMSDAIMVGGNTLLGDDPKLLVKSPQLRAERLQRGQPENPIKVGVLSRIEDPQSGPTLHDESRFVTAGPARRIVFTSQQTDNIQIERLSRLGVEVIPAGEQRVDLPTALQHLHIIGVNRLLVEGGGTLNAELLRHSLVDEIYLYIAPLIFAGAAAPTFAGGEGLTREDAIPLKLSSVETMEDGSILLHYILARTTP